MDGRNLSVRAGSLSVFTAKGCSIASVLGVKQQAAPVEPRRSKISVRQKPLLLSIHLVFITTWLGGGICSIVLNITALRATDPHLLNAIYVYADIFEKFVVRSGTAGMLISGLLVAFLTQWTYRVKIRLRGKSCSAKQSRDGNR